MLGHVYFFPEIFSSDNEKVFSKMVNITACSALKLSFIFKERF